MKSKILIAIVALAAAFNWQIGAQTYDTNNVVVQTFAGSGFSGYVDGQGTQTMFNKPFAIVADSSSNLFVLDRANFRIRKITPDGAVSTFAGGGTNGLPGYGTNVSLTQTVQVSPSYYGFGSMTIDHSNVLWITISYSLTSTLFLRIAPDAYVSKITWSALPGGSGQNTVEGSCVDSGNNVYFSVTPLNGNLGNRIYRYRTDGSVEVFAGSGNQGSADGNGVFTSFYNPGALAVDSADNIYVWDSGNYLIRRINQNRDVVIIAGKNSSNADGVGTNASFGSVSAMRVDNSGNIIMACGASVRKMSATTNVTTLAGSFSQSGYTNGTGNLARFSGANGVYLSQGLIFVADSNNERIRQISFNPQPEFVSSASFGISTYAGLSITGVVGRTYQIQSSPDMNNWSTVATVLLTSNPYLWIDQNPVSGNKYYRALLLP